jgi:hypothetical protein
MTEEVQPSTHQTMMDTFLRGDHEGAQKLSQQVNIEAGIERTAQADGELAPLAPMPHAPKIETDFVTKAIATLTDLGGDHAALVQEWQQTGANPAEEIAYAKAAFSKHATPELIAKFDASGLGNDPAVLRFLAKQGRLDAGMMGDFSVARNDTSTESQVRAPTSGSKAAQSELDKIFSETPPGSAGYRKPSVQARVRQLNEAIHGTGPAVGKGGRTV